MRFRCRAFEAKRAPRERFQVEAPETVERVPPTVRPDSTLYSALLPRINSPTEVSA